MAEIMTLLVSLVLQGHSCLSASALPRRLAMKTLMVFVSDWRFLFFDHSCLSASALLLVGGRFLRQRVLKLRRASDLCLRLMRIVVEEIALCLVP